MSTGRRSARRHAVFVLYQQDLLKLETAAALSRDENGDMDEYAARIVKGVASARPRIDGLLEAHLSEWSLERLGILERSILRVATYELLEERDVPVAVVVDEAVNLAKRFCSMEAGALINGILGNAATEARSTDPEGAV